MSNPLDKGHEYALGTMRGLVQSLVRGLAVGGVRASESVSMSPCASRYVLERERPYRASLVITLSRRAVPALT